MASPATEESIVTTDGKIRLMVPEGACATRWRKHPRRRKTLSLRDLTKNGMNGKEDVAKGYR